MKKTILATCLFYSASTLAAGIPVYSAAEYSQQVLTHIEILNDAVVQLEKLGVMDQQLTTQLESLMTQAAQLDQQVKNARRLYGQYAYVDDTDIHNVIDEVQDVLGKIDGLDPRNNHFDKAAEDIVYQKYGDPTQLASEKLSGNTAAIERLDRQGERIQSGYEDYLTYQKYTAAKNQLAADREQMISQYGTQLNSLGDNSSLATQQLTSYQINLLLRQQEEVIQSVSELNQREERREQEERALELDAYQDKINTLHRRANTTYKAGE